MIKAKNKRQKPIIPILSIILLICIAVGTTSAVLGSITNSKRNIFLPSDNIRTTLAEPNWDSSQGLDLVPGRVINKDPIVTNKAETDIYVSINLTFERADGKVISDEELLRFLNLTEITWNNKWKLCNGTLSQETVNQPLIFYYEDKLLPGGVTEPIFSTIRIKDKSDGLTENDLRWLQAVKIEDGKIVADITGLGNLHIIVDSVAVQAIGFADAQSASTELIKLFD